MKFTSYVLATLFLFIASVGFGPCSTTPPPSAVAASDPATADSAVTTTAATTTAAQKGSGKSGSAHGSPANAKQSRTPATAAAASPHAPPVILAGPPKIDVSSSHPDTVRVCKTKNDCDDGMMICSAQHNCLCDVSRGYGRCGEGDECHNELTDANNCGKCGHQCPSGQACTNGSCGAFTCDPGLTVCLDYCANLQKDDADCGKCGHECPGGLSCVSGHCEP